MGATVIDAPRLGTKGESAPRGLKHFAPGARVYISPIEGFDFGHWERAQVAGTHRDDGRLAIVWVDTRRLEAFEVCVLPSELSALLDEQRVGRDFSRWKSSDAAEFVRWRNALDKHDWEAEVARSRPRK